MTAVGARHALLYDTEAALRLVDGEVRALTAGDAAPGPPAFEQASAEVRAVLASVRNSRAVLEGLEAADQTAAVQAVAGPALSDIEERLVLLAELLEASAGGRPSAPRVAVSAS